MLIYVREREYLNYKTLHIRCPDHLFFLRNNQSLCYPCATTTKNEGQEAYRLSYDSFIKDCSFT